MTTRHLHPLPISAQDDLVMVGREALQPTEARELAVRYREASAQLVHAAADAERHIRTARLRAALEAEVQHLRTQGWEVYETSSGTEGPQVVALSPEGKPFGLYGVPRPMGQVEVVRRSDGWLRIRYHRAETRLRVVGGRVAHTVTRASPECCVRCNAYIGPAHAQLHLADEALADCKLPSRRTPKAQRQLYLGETDA